MGRYLDPKTDVVFKKIFGQHPHLLKSFLNALLPLPENRQIVSLEYLPSEQIPSIPAFKRTIVDVKCRDQEGKIFIVEMQIEWTKSFMQRLLFGSAQAYVKQLKPGENYPLLNPVYGLALIDSIFDEKSTDWYHHYGIVKLTDPKEQLIDGLSLIFVELPKFKPETWEERKLRVLWLRFMREVNRETKEIDSAFDEVPEIQEAIALAEEASYSPEELESYEGYWKAVSSERTLIHCARAEGRNEGRAEGREEGRAEGREEGKLNTAREIAKKMRKSGFSLEEIHQLTGYPIEDIEKL